MNGRIVAAVPHSYTVNMIIRNEKFRGRERQAVSTESIDSPISAIMDCTIPDCIAHSAFNMNSCIPNVAKQTTINRQISHLIGLQGISASTFEGYANK
jgi:hypothetical protein